MECTSCHCELTGGLDTFGPPHEEMCFACFISGDLRMDEKRKLEEELTEAEDELEEKRIEKEEIDNYIDELESEIRDIRKKLNGQPVSQREDAKRIKEKMAKWVGAPA